ncbi:hypothetical protein JCM33374_g1001 [Metschnikowia sp. JCM 33374]|nr:hypothetical protein JCM33374_g1001 [Metschnikowia sp. JCM 33374]
MIPMCFWFATVVVLISTSSALTIYHGNSTNSKPQIEVQEHSKRREHIIAIEGIAIPEIGITKNTDHVYHAEFRPSIPEQEARLIKASLNKFVTNLKAFAQGTRFDMQTFEASGETLDRTLAAIEDSIRTAGVPDVVLGTQLGFAQHMFQTMGVAIEQLKHFQGIDTPGHNLVWPLIDLNVRLLALCNVYGAPDPSIDGYTHRVSLYNEYLYMMKDAFDAYVYIPFGIQMSFKIQFERAEHTLAMLSAHT